MPCSTDAPCWLCALLVDVQHAAACGAVVCRVVAQAYARLRCRGHCTPQPHLLSWLLNLLSSGLMHNSGQVTAPRTTRDMCTIECLHPCNSSHFFVQVTHLFHHDFVREATSVIPRTYQQPVLTWSCSCRCHTCRGCRRTGGAFGGRCASWTTPWPTPWRCPAASSSCSLVRSRAVLGLACVVDYHRANALAMPGGSVIAFTGAHLPCS